MIANIKEMAYIFVLFLLQHATNNSFSFIILFKSAILSTVVLNFFAITLLITNQCVAKKPVFFLFTNIYNFVY